nr:MAG TPA: hypothetical protein [Caudoviricetes sp.]
MMSKAATTCLLMRGLSVLYASPMPRLSMMPSLRR